MARTTLKVRERPFSALRILYLISPSIGGVVLVSLSDHIFEPRVHLRTLLWALAGAILYALYLVLLRRRVDNEEKLNIPMFFGESTNFRN